MAFRLPPLACGARRGSIGPAIGGPGQRIRALDSAIPLHFHDRKNSRRAIRQEAVRRSFRQGRRALRANAHSDAETSLRFVSEAAASFRSESVTGAPECGEPEAIASVHLSRAREERMTRDPAIWQSLLARADERIGSCARAMLAPTSILRGRVAPGHERRFEGGF